jgi:hypothetical protein
MRVPAFFRAFGYVIDSGRADRWRAPGRHPGPSTGRDRLRLLPGAPATIAIVGEVSIRRLRHATPAFRTRSEIWLSLFTVLGVQTRRSAGGCPWGDDRVRGVIVTTDTGRHPAQRRS